VYQLRIIRCSTIIAFGVYRVNKQRKLFNAQWRIRATITNTFLFCSRPAKVNNSYSRTQSQCRRFNLLSRDAEYSADYAVARCPSVCPSVRHTPLFYRNAVDLEWPLKVISVIVNDFIVCISKIRNVRSQIIQRSDDVICQQSFLMSYSTGRCSARLVNDS